MLHVAREGHSLVEPILLQRELPHLVDRMAASLHRSIELKVPEDLPPASGSLESVRQVLENLIGNADKYSPENEPIAVRARHTEGEVEISVRDHGPGMAPGEYERVFEAYFRSLGARRIRGLGLGLTVCRRLVEAHGGRIWAEPAAGGGSVFAFSMPDADLGGE
jgi:signal transduction histidine kinase